MANTACTWALHWDRIATSLARVPHQFSQFPGFRRRDPRVRQPPHPQQVSQIRGVTLIIFDPPKRKAFHPKRVRQMHRRAELGERIGGPIPPVSRLQHHLRRLAGTRHHLRQHATVVENPYRLQMFAGLAHPHQHRAATMQIHTDKLPTLIQFAHKGPPSS